jgi:hypothetical protein
MTAVIGLEYQTQSRVSTVSRYSDFVSCQPLFNCPNPTREGPYIFIHLTFEELSWRDRGKTDTQSYGMADNVTLRICCV